MSGSAPYGSAWFEAASELRLDGGLGQPRRLAILVAAIVRRPARIVALMRLVAGTRSERIQLSDAPAGQALRRYFDERFLAVFPRNRLCRGVLVLPRDHADYLRGRHRQAVRTNLRRAGRAGIDCQTTPEPRSGMDAAWTVIGNRRAPLTEEDLANLTMVWPRLMAEPEATVMIARDPQGVARAVTVAVIDEWVCLIRLAVASSHEARWALHDHLVRVLIARGVKYLLAEGDGPFGALGFAAAMHHYQRLLGYELRHLMPAGAPRPALGPERRRQASTVRLDSVGVIQTRTGEDGVRMR
jgi:hypothetical protein